MQESGKQAPGAKSTYTRPELRNYGTLEFVTKAVSKTSSVGDNGNPPNHKTS